jgi:hypothetical protein
MADFMMNCKGKTALQVHDDMPPLGDFSLARVPTNILSEHLAIRTEVRADLRGSFCAKAQLLHG